MAGQQCFCLDKYTTPQMNKLIKNWLQHTLSLSLSEPKKNHCYYWSQRYERVFFLTFYLHRTLFNNSQSAFSFGFFFRVHMWSCADLGMSESISCIPSRSIHCFFFASSMEHTRPTFFSALCFCCLFVVTLSIHSWMKRVNWMDYPSHFKVPPNKLKFSLWGMTSDEKYGLKQLNWDE